jgi:hypothetical protein
MNEREYDFPTEVLDLPSQGKLYPKDNPLSSGRITIKCMTAKEEDILSNQNLIKKGVVLDKLFESIIVDNGINPKDILIGDKNAILLATRLLGYGPDYNFKFYSNVTGDVISTTIDLAKIQTKEVDMSAFNNKNEFDYTTPFGKTKLTFKLLTHGDEIAIEKDIEGMQKINKEFSGEITTRLRYMIKSVEGDTSLGAITKYLNNMLARDSKAFREYVKTISPDVDMSFTYTHRDGEKEVSPIPMGVGFFWPSSES